MARALRSRTIDASTDRVWELVEDPHHMPRWWPGVTRMENVHADRFTQVFMTKRGRPVRVDLHVLESERLGEGGASAGRRSWEQEVLGTPFERVLQEAVTEIVVEPLSDGTASRVSIAQRQKLRGYSRTGGLLLRRATGKKLDEALDGLERVCG